jgi:hypothetical protein
MKYAVQVASGGMIFIPSFMVIDTGVQKLLGRAVAHTELQAPTCAQTARFTHKPTFIFLKQGK